jgi:hypothetical protein
MRRALDLSIEQGKSREAAVLYNNLSVDTWLHEGPQAALATSREGSISASGAGSQSSPSRSRASA